MSLDTNLVRWILCRYTCLGTEISERTAVRLRRVNSDKHTNISVKCDIEKNAHKYFPTPIFVLLSVKHPVQCGYLCQGQCQCDDDGDDSEVTDVEMETPA